MIIVLSVTFAGDSFLQLHSQSTSLDVSFSSSNAFGVNGNIKCTCSCGLASTPCQNCNYIFSGVKEIQFLIVVVVITISLCERSYTYTIKWLHSYVSWFEEDIETITNWEILSIYICVYLHRYNTYCFCRVSATATTV